jgi:PIN domain nuclease of toxin-antitoxin system
MILLDTHVWVRWLDTESNPLPNGLVQLIESADQLTVSAITCWEIGWLVKKGRLTLSIPLREWLDLALDQSGVACLPIDRDIAVLASELPEHHRDPADRMIIATAIRHGCYLASLDSNFRTYSEIAEHLITA